MWDTHRVEKEIDSKRFMCKVGLKDFNTLFVEKKKYLAFFPVWISE